MEIKRNKYVDLLFAKRGNGQVKIVTGIRRCGKSYLLFKLFAKKLMEEGVKDDHIIRLELDIRENRKFRDPDLLLEYVKSRLNDNDLHYLLLDEVQLLEDFEEVLNSFLHIDNLEVYVTGSNSKFLSSDIVTEFRGRGDEIRVWPLSFKEYFDFKGDSYEECYEQYMLYGGMPGLVQHSDVEKRRYLFQLFSNVYINDVVERNRIRSKSDLDDILNVLSSCTGSLTNANKIANTLKSEKSSNATYNTVSKYIEYLEDAFMISQAKRYDIKGRQYVNAGLKYYFVDTGLRNARLNFNERDYSHLMENIIFNELLRRGYSVDVGMVEAGEENSSGNYVRKQFEVDFVVNEFDKRYYIQSVFEMGSSREKQLQERKSFRQIRDGYDKIIIQQGTFSEYTDSEGYKNISLKEFLLTDRL